MPSTSPKPEEIQCSPGANPLHIPLVKIHMRAFDLILPCLLKLKYSELFFKVFISLYSFFQRPALYSISCGPLPQSPLDNAKAGERRGKESFGGSEGAFDKERITD